MTLSPRAAAAAGYVAGVIFFALDFAWFGETAGSLLGPFAFILDLGPALLEALAFAVTAAIVAYAARTLRGGWIAVAAASAFAVTEWLRSRGELGVPLYGIAAPFIATPLAALFAFAGEIGVTFTIALAAALAAHAAVNRSRSALIVALAGWTAIAVLALCAWLAWPARTLAAPTLRVAAIQANIKQSLKWEPASLPIAIDRHIALTIAATSFHPQLIVWPETVIPTTLLIDPRLAAVPANADAARDAAALRARFGQLAQRMHAQLVLGSVEETAAASAPDGVRPYNDLFVFDPGGALARVYRKRKLVPFTEYLPGPAWLRRLPGGNLPSDFGHGIDPAVIAPYGIAPLICWEADFSGLAQVQAARGARLFVVATDDAWFGSGDGPEAHAQLTQVRAVETGRWVIRAASTGVSGIIAPDGGWRERTAVGVPAVLTGLVGEPAPTAYAGYGPVPLGLALWAAGLFAFAVGRRRP